MTCCEGSPKMKGNIYFATHIRAESLSTLSALFFQKCFNVLLNKEIKIDCFPFLSFDVGFCNNGKNIWSGGHCLLR